MVSRGIRTLAGMSEPASFDQQSAPPTAAAAAGVGKLRRRGTPVPGTTLTGHGIILVMVGAAALTALAVFITTSASINL